MHGRRFLLNYRISDFQDCITKTLLRPNDFDLSWQLNNSVFVELFEFGRWEWAKLNGINLTESELLGVVVRLELDYIKPIFWGFSKQLSVRTSVHKIENYSFHLQQEILDDLDCVYALGSLRLALFDKNERKAVPLTKEGGRAEVGRRKSRSCAPRPKLSS